MDVETAPAVNSVFVNDEVALSDEPMEEEKPKEAEAEKQADAPTFELMVYKEDEADGAANDTKDPLESQEADDSSIDYYSSDGVVKRLKLEKVRLIHPDKEAEVEEKSEENNKTEDEASVTGIVDIYSLTSKGKGKLKGFNCFSCQENFTDINLFKDHLMIHSEEENIFCTDCKKTFKTIHGLIFHANNHVSKVKEEKNDVNNDKNSIDSLLSMMKGPYVCKICKTKCYDITSFKHHITLHNSKDKTYECNKCKRVFLQMKKLMNHVCQPVAAKQRAERSASLTNANNLKPEVIKSPPKSPSTSKSSDSEAPVYYGYNPPPFATGEYHNTCFKCYQSFDDYYDLKVHVATCEGLYKCPPCQKSFMLEYKLLCHTQFHKILRPFQCDKCNLEFLSLNSFKIHLVGHGSCDYYQCMLCDKRFEHKGSLIYHSFGHMEKNFVCSYCGKEYDRQTEMQYHKVRFHSKTDKTYNCSHCHEQLPNSIRLRQHVAKFHKRRAIKYYKCEECDQTFINSINYDRHKQIHLSAKDKNSKAKFLQCDICFKRFIKLELLETHRLYHNENLLECPDCKRKFLDEYQMNLHVCSVNKEKTHKCALCDKEFPRPTALGSHMRMHRNEELRRLAEEGKPIPPAESEPKVKHEIKELAISPSSSDYFAPQEREKVYECKICNKIFFRGTALRSHMRVHGDEDGNVDFLDTSAEKKETLDHSVTESQAVADAIRPYECKVCGRKFLKATGLGSHLRIHKNDGTYVEDEEDESNYEYREYDTLETLKARTNVKAKDYIPAAPTPPPKKEKKFECNVCGKVYNQPHFLGSHMRLHKTPKQGEANGSFKEEDMSDLNDSGNPDFDTSSFVTTELDETVNDESANESVNEPVNESKQNGSFTNQKLNYVKGPNGKYHCSECKKPFNRPAALGSHMRVHRASYVSKVEDKPEVKDEPKEEGNNQEKMETEVTQNGDDSEKMETEPIANNEDKPGSDPVPVPLKAES